MTALRRPGIVALYSIVAVAILVTFLSSPRKAEVTVMSLTGPMSVRAEIVEGSTTRSTTLQLPIKMRMNTADFSVRVYPDANQRLSIEAEVRSVAWPRVRAAVQGASELGIRGARAHLSACSGEDCLSKAG